MMFRNREDAAEQLAQRLNKYRGEYPLVLAIPRGAVPMGFIIAEALGGELDVVLVRKLGAPSQPEFAIGAVDEFGHVYVSDVARDIGVGRDYMLGEAREQLIVLRNRRARYTPLRPPADPKGRLVIVVDDGSATGATMLAALRATQAKQPRRLIGAVAVVPPPTLAQLEAEADEIVCLAAPSGFYAVGQFFEDFSQVTDDEVATILKESASQGALPRGEPKQGTTLHRA